MKKNIFYAIFILGLILISCRRQWNDIIMLSGYEYSFSAGGDSTIITSKGTSWGLADVMLDSTHYFLGQSNNTCKQTFIDSSFKIERRSCDTLFVKINPNKTNSSRTLWIQLQAGDYFSSITFTQTKR